MTKSTDSNCRRSRSVARSAGHAVVLVLAVADADADPAFCGSVLAPSLTVRARLPDGGRWTVDHSYTQWCKFISKNSNFALESRPDGEGKRAR